MSSMNDVEIQLTDSF